MHKTELEKQEEFLSKNKMNLDDETEICIWCGKEFMMGIDGNELGFCVECQENPDFPYDIEAYYNDYDEGKTIFKGFETLSRGILEKYRK